LDETVTQPHHVVTLHSNPCRYAKPEENYWAFREALPGYVRLHTMEVSYDGVFVIPDALHVCAGPEHLLWQKEAAMRWLIREHVPRGAEVVTWCDADVIFEDPDVFLRAEELIKSGRHVVVQPYSRVIRLDADGGVQRDQCSFAAARSELIASKMSRDQLKYPAPGLAWTAPRAIAERIFVRDAGGGGDATMAHLWAGEFTDYRFTGMHRSWRRAILRRGVWHYRRVLGRIGCVDTTATHLYHGEMENRQYAERHRVLIQQDFDPDRDVEIDPAYGLLRWSSDKPVLHQYLRDLFVLRREDGEPRSEVQNSSSETLSGVTLLSEPETKPDGDSTSAELSRLAKSLGLDLS
jgi:hypothetical protein